MAASGSTEHLYVLVAGWPGSGKSTLAPALAEELGVALLSKDAIKESLMDSLGRPSTVSESRRFGRAAVLVMLQVAGTCPGAVLDSTFFAYAVPTLRSLPGRLVEVQSIVPVELARERYAARSAERHAGHLDDDRDEDELWGSPPAPLGVGPVLTVDTQGPVDVGRLASDVVSAALAQAVR